MFDEDDKAYGISNVCGVHFGENSASGVFILCALSVGDECPPELSNLNDSSGGKATASVISNVCSLLKGADETSIMSVSCVEDKASRVTSVGRMSFGDDSKSGVFITFGVYGTDNRESIDCDSSRRTERSPTLSTECVLSEGVDEESGVLNVHGVSLEEPAPGVFIVSCLSEKDDWSKLSNLNDSSGEKDAAFGISTV